MEIVADEAMTSDYVRVDVTDYRLPLKKHFSGLNTSLMTIRPGH